jgi:hypothetical protein
MVRKEVFESIVEVVVPEGLELSGAQYARSSLRLDLEQSHVLPEGAEMLFHYTLTVGPVTREAVLSLNRVNQMWCEEARNHRYVMVGSGPVTLEHSGGEARTYYFLRDFPETTDEREVGT